MDAFFQKQSKALDVKNRKWTKDIGHSVLCEGKQIY